MIEEALRKQLEPIVSRRNRAYLARRLSLYWFMLGLVALALHGAEWYWGWWSPSTIWALCISTILVTALTIYKSGRRQPDYTAIAKNIEQQHPDIRALLLAAIEQQPRGPDGQFGYLQDLVIGKALRHAASHDWLDSIPPKKVMAANAAAVASLLFFVSAFAQVLAGVSFSDAADKTVPPGKGYSVTVTPGDASVELGTPVVIVARFDGRVPPQATLVVRPAQGESGQGEQIALTKNLDDPVFGGVIQQVKSDMLYYIEYADRRTRDYRISVYEHPSLVRADAKIIYPAYTKLPEKAIEDTRQVSAVEGSQITLTFMLNKPVATAQLTAKDQPPVDLTVDSNQPNVYSASITAAQSRRYELHLTDAQGLKNKVPPRFVIDVHKNTPAELKPVFPARDVVASPLEELSLEADVSDDFGVIAYGLSYTLVGAQSMDIVLGRPLSNDKQQIRYLLSLEDVNAQPDQLLTYHFWADDTGPDGKIRRTSSDIYFAEVRHFEDIFRESESFQDQRNQEQRQQQDSQSATADRQRSEQLARLQKQIIIATWNVKQRAEQDRSMDAVEYEEDVNVVRQSQADALNQARSPTAQGDESQGPDDARSLGAATKYMETALSHLTKAHDSLSTDELTPALSAEQSAYQELLKLRQREFQVAQGRSASRSNSDARMERQLQQLELRQRENRYETQRMARSQEQETRREDLQVLNRLGDLARRQNEVSDRLRELEAALRQEQTAQQRQETLRELRRLRDEQLEALRDVDEIQQRMETPQNRQRMADSRQQLDDSRSRIRESAEQLEQGMVSNAITSATRAQRQLEQMRDQLRRSTSSQFSDQMRDMRDQAQELDRRQRDITEQIRQEVDSGRKTLAGSSPNTELADRMGQQRGRLGELTDQIKDVSDQSETSEPLLSRKLYDTLRRASTENIDKSLDVSAELLKRSFLRQAQDVERQAAKGIEDLRKGVEDAAEGVLGDEAESLRLAQRQLDELIRQVNEEAARAAAGGTGADANGAGAGEPNQSRLADARSARGGRQQGEQGMAPSNDQAPENASQGRGARADSGRAGRRQGGSQPDNTQRGGRRTARANAGNPTGGGGPERVLDDAQNLGWSGPLTGRDFTQWSDQLREVEEMLTTRELRDEAARVRDRAREMRADFTRHGKQPQWDLVAQQITKPLTELQKRLAEKLAQLQSDEAIVPIDRDPVPGRYIEIVRSYFENLGEKD